MTSAKLLASRTGGHFFENDPLLSGRSPRGKVLHVGGYPIKFLEQIVQLSKCLKKKRELIGCLRTLNGQVDKAKVLAMPFTKTFKDVQCVGIVSSQSGFE